MRSSRSWRSTTLGRLEHAPAELREVLDSLLDFSRFRAEVSEPEVVAGRLAAVLEVAQLDCPTTGGGDAVGAATVVVDPALAGHGLALMVPAGRSQGGTSVETQLRASASGPELGLLLTGPGLAAGSQVQLGTRLLIAAGARVEPAPATGSATVWFPTRTHLGPKLALLRAPSRSFALLRAPSRSLALAPALPPNAKG